MAFNCDTVSGPYLGYKFGYRKGNESSDFFTGWMTTNNGRADANTEQHNTPSQATVYFGCASVSTCLPDWGIAARTFVQWGVCCSSAPNQFHDDPPYLKIINNWYSFKTCQTSGPCT